MLGVVVLLLAAMAPGAWATPNQNPLRQTLPSGDVNATDPTGVIKNLFQVGESVHVRVKNGSFTPGSQVDVYVVVDDLWTIGKAITADVSGGMETLIANANGAFDGPPFPQVWAPPLVPGNYDVVFDANRDGLFNDTDGVDDAVLGTGFVVQAPPPPVPVGGIAILPNRFELLAPWVGLAALIGVVAVAAVVRLRKQA